MLSCTSVRVRAWCLFSCSDQTHQGWLLFRRHHSVSIMTVRLANVNLKSSSSPLPLGVNQHAVTDYLGFLGLFLHFLLNFWNCSTDGIRKMKHSRILWFLYLGFCAAHHLLSDEARHSTGPVQYLHLSDRCCIRLLQIKPVSKMLIKTSSNLYFMYTNVHNCTVTELLSLLPSAGSCQFLVWCLASFMQQEKNLWNPSSARKPLSEDQQNCLSDFFRCKQNSQISTWEQFL